MELIPYQNVCPASCFILLNPEIFKTKISANLLSGADNDYTIGGIVFALMTYFVVKTKIMIKKLLFTFAILLFVHILHAQVMENRVKLDTSIQPSFYFEIDMPQDMVNNALDAYFKSKGIEKEKGKGFIIKKGMPFELYRRAKVDSFESEYLDFYFVLGTKKQKGPDLTTIHVSASQGYNNFVSREQSTASWDGLRGFSEYMRTSYLPKYRIQREIDEVTKDDNKAKTRFAELQTAAAAMAAIMTDKDSKLKSLKEQLEKIQ